MPSFRYRAMTQAGEIVSGAIWAANAAEVGHRIEYLGLVPIDTTIEEGVTAVSPPNRAPWSRPRPEDVTAFTRDLGLLLKAGARINDALELLSQEIDIGRLRTTVAKIRSAILVGESFAEAISHYPTLFPPVYVALVRVGETSGTLDQILELLCAERVRAETLRRRLADGLRYPIFVLFAACAVLAFFLLYVLPQFAAVLRDFNAKLDPVVTIFLDLSDFFRIHTDAIFVSLLIVLVGSIVALRSAGTRRKVMGFAFHLPLMRSILTFHQTALFCRNLGVLLTSGVALTTTLRILADMMATFADNHLWSQTVDRVRHGGKLSDALMDTAALPSMAVRMLRLGEETGQLAMLAGRVAEFYEARLQRSLDRVVGIVGPLAIITISIVVGGLIVSVMTALLSVSQMVG